MKLNLPILFLLFILLVVPTASVQASGSPGAGVERGLHQEATPAPADGRTLVAWLDLPVTLRPGQWAAFSGAPGGFGVQFQEVVSDTRCPARAACEIAGEAVIRLAVRQDDQIMLDAIELSTSSEQGQSQAAYAGYDITLLAVDPPMPTSGKQPPPHRYRATLLVRAGEALPTPAPTVAPSATPEPTAEPTVAPTATPLPPAIRSDEATLETELGQPFILLPGQTAALPDEDLTVTLRSLSDDSGCFAPGDCSIMTADGTLALKLGDERNLLTFSVGMHEGEPFVTEFGPYAVQMHRVEQTDAGQEVTFVVLGPAAAAVPIPEPQRVEGCDAFSRFDAAAILQEEVSEWPVANLVLGPVLADAPVLNGYCGYNSAADMSEQELDKTLPYVASAVGADHAAVAAHLAGADTQELLHLLALVNGGQEPEDPTTLPVLTTMFAAGMTDELLAELYAVAAENPAARVEWLDGIGDEALSIQLDANNGQYIAVISREGDAFNLVAALIGPEVAAADALGFSMTVLGKLAATAR